MIALNEYYKNSGSEEDFEQELEKIAIKNNFDILIKDNNGINIYSTNKNFSSVIGSLGNMIVNSGEVLETTENFTIKRQRDMIDQEIKWLHKCLGICHNKEYFR